MVEVPLSPAAIAALHEGDKIQAIKIVRRERGLGLKESKDLVDAYIRSQPLLHQAYTEAQAQARRGALLWVAIVVAVLVAAGLYLATR